MLRIFADVVPEAGTAGMIGRKDGNDSKLRGTQYPLATALDVLV
jgi:hypothetical protein